MEQQYPRLHRFCEMLPGLLTWSILVLPWLLLFITPWLSLGFLLLYIVLWFLRSLYFSFCLLRSFWHYRQHEALPWDSILQQGIDHPSSLPATIPARLRRDITQRLSAIPAPHLQPTDIYHVVIIATYKEPYMVLHETLEALSQATYDPKKLIIVLACEERDREQALHNASQLQNTFGKHFYAFVPVLHPKDLPNEAPGKGANITYAGHAIASYIQQEGIDPSHVLVTTLDADHKVHNHYFSVLTYYYITTPDRHKRSYQPLPLFYNNIWDVPVFNRLVAMSSSFWHLIESGRPEHLRNFASQAQPLDALIAMGFWSRTSIVEDGHQFWRAYFHFNGHHKVIPLFIPIYQDAVQSATYTTTLKDQYLQLRRWAYGASDVAYVITNTVANWKQLPKIHTLNVLYYLIQGHILWATSAMMLTFAGPMQQALTHYGTNTIMQANLAKVLSTMFSITLSGIFVSMLISFLTIPRPKDRSWWPKLLHTFQWFLLPIITILYGSIPAIDAQTRLMLGKYLHFNVTKKVRKTS